MEDGTSVKPMNSPFLPKRSFARWKEKPFRTKDYLEFLAHYDAELRQTEGPIVVIRRKAGTELPLEQKGRLMMVRLLLEEFGTVDAANKAIADCRSSRS